MIYRVVSRKKAIVSLFAFVVVAAAVAVCCVFSVCLPTFAVQQEKKTDYIKYVEFNVPYSALQKALELDIQAHAEGDSKDWVETLAYLAAKYGGDFSRYKSRDMDTLMEKLDAGETMESLTDRKSVV